MKYIPFKETALKILLTIPTGTFFFHEKWWKVILALCFIIIVDTILGIWVAIKYKKFSSWKLGRLASKISRYSLALFTVYFLCVANPTIFSWAFPYVGTFFVLTEVISNFEKLALLGLELPTNFLSKLNSDFKKLKDKSNSDVAKKILNKDCEQ